MRRILSHFQGAGWFQGKPTAPAILAVAWIRFACVPRDGLFREPEL